MRRTVLVLVGIFILVAGLWWLWGTRTSPPTEADTPKPLEAIAPEPAPHPARSPSSVGATPLIGSVEDEDGRPVGGAEVSAWLQVDQASPYRTRATPDGLFQLPLPAGEYRISAASEGFAPNPAMTIRVPAAGQVRIVLRAISSLEGVIVNERGAPVAATVKVASFHGGGQETTHSDWSASADPQGHFRAVGFPKGPVRLRVSHPDYVELIVEVRAPDRQLRLVLADGEGIEGIVLDERDVPQHDVRVRVGLKNANPTLSEQLSPGKQTVTDSQGRFQVMGLGKGAFRVSATQNLGHQEARSTKIDLMIPRVPNDLVQLKFGEEEISGWVFDARNARVAGAEVSAEATGAGSRLVDSQNESEPSSNQTVSGKDGSFRLRFLSPGLYAVTARPPVPEPDPSSQRTETLGPIARFRRLTGPRAMAMASAGQSNVTLTIEEAAGLSPPGSQDDADAGTVGRDVQGDVTDAVTGAPVAGAQVTADMTARMRTDAAGKFALAVTPGEKHELLIKDPLHCDERVAFVHAAVHVRLRPCGAIRARVVNGSGAPVSGARVQVTGRSVARDGATDTQGTVVVRNLPEQTFDIGVESNGVLYDVQRVMINAGEIQQLDFAPRR